MSIRRVYGRQKYVIALSDDRLPRVVAVYSQLVYIYFTHLHSVPHIPHPVPHLVNPR